MVNDVREIAKTPKRFLKVKGPKHPSFFVTTLTSHLLNPWVRSARRRLPVLSVRKRRKRFTTTVSKKRKEREWIVSHQNRTLLLNRFIDSIKQCLPPPLLLVEEIFRVRAICCAVIGPRVASLVTVLHNMFHKRYNYWITVLWHQVLWHLSIDAKSVLQCLKYTHNYILHAVTLWMRVQILDFNLLLLVTNSGCKWNAAPNNGLKHTFQLVCKTVSQTFFAVDRQYQWTSFFNFWNLDNFSFVSFITEEHETLHCFSCSPLIN